MKHDKNDPPHMHCICCGRCNRLLKPEGMNGIYFCGPCSMHHKPHTFGKKNVK